MSERRCRKLTANEWALIGMVLFGLVMVLLRWDYISSEVVRSVSGYFK